VSVYVLVGFARLRPVHGKVGMVVPAVRQMRTRAKSAADGLVQSSVTLVGVLLCEVSPVTGPGGVVSAATAALVSAVAVATTATPDRTNVATLRHSMKNPSIAPELTDLSARAP
jgi:hypothetical protein